MTASTAQPPERRAGDVQSVARAAALLACFAEADTGLTLTELARRTALNVSTAHRLLGTLCHQGLLCREQGTDRFLPGPLLLRLSRSSLLADDLSEISAHLQALVDETRESACFGVRRGEEVVILLAVPSPEPLRVEIVAGTRGSVATTAMGHALLAFGDEPIDEAIPALATAPADLRIDLLATQFRGYSLVDGQPSAGIRALAAPIRTGERTHAALELRGPADRMLDADRLGRRLQEHAADIARLPTAAAL